MQQTKVQQLRQALSSPTFKSLKELSQELRLPEKELPDLLEKLSLTLKHEAKQVQGEPARCLACDFRFEQRARFSRPSRCPSCRSERISQPRFRVE